MDAELPLCKSVTLSYNPGQKVLRKIRFLLHQTSQFYYILSPFCQTTTDFAKNFIYLGSPSPPPGLMLVLCPSAYGLTTETKFGRDNVVVGGGGGGERKGGNKN